TGQDTPSAVRIGKGVVNDAAWLPDDRTLVVAGARGLWLYDAQALDAPPQLVETPAGWVSRVLVGGDLLVAGHRDGSLTLWKATLPLGQAARLPDAGALRAMSRDGHRLVTVKGQALIVWDTSRLTSVLKIDLGDSGSTVIGDAAISDDGERLIFAIGSQSCDVGG